MPISPEDVYVPLQLVTSNVRVLRDAVTVESLGTLFRPVIHVCLSVFAPPTKCKTPPLSLCLVGAMLPTAADLDSNCFIDYD